MRLALASSLTVLLASTLFSAHARAEEERICALPVVMRAGITDIQEGRFNGPVGFAFFAEAPDIKTGDLPLVVGREPVRRFDAEVYASNFQGPIRVDHPGLRVQWEWSADGELEISERSYPLVYAHRCAESAEALGRVVLHVSEHDEAPLRNDRLGRFEIDLRACDAALVNGRVQGWSARQRIGGTSWAWSDFLPWGFSDVAFVEVELWCYRCPGPGDCARGIR